MANRCPPLWWRIGRSPFLIGMSCDDKKAGQLVCVAFRIGDGRPWLKNDIVPTKSKKDKMPEQKISSWRRVPWWFIEWPKLLSSAASQNVYIFRTLLFLEEYSLIMHEKDAVDLPTYQHRIISSVFLNSWPWVIFSFEAKRLVEKMSRFLSESVPDDNFFSIL